MHFKEFLNHRLSIYKSEIDFDFVCYIVSLFM